MYTCVVVVNITSSSSALPINMGDHFSPYLASPTEYIHLCGIFQPFMRYFLSIYVIFSKHLCDIFYPFIWYFLSIYVIFSMSWWKALKYLHSQPFSLFFKKNYPVGSVVSDFLFTMWPNMLTVSLCLLKLPLCLRLFQNIKIT